MPKDDQSERVPTAMGRIVNDGDSQTVVFPKGFDLPFKRVSFRKDGDRVILEKAPPLIVVWLSRMRTWLNRR